MADKPVLVKQQILDTLSGSPKRYSELVKQLARPDKTIFVNLRSLQEKGFVAKTDERYYITESGRGELRRLGLSRLVDIWAELEVDLSAGIAKLWDQKHLWKRWVDNGVPHYEGRFPDRCKVIRNLGTKWKYRLVTWQGRLWAFSLASAADAEHEGWEADPFKNSVSQKSAELCVEADAILSVA